MSINEILPAALIIGVAVIGVSIIAQILGQIKSTQTANSAEYNLTGAGITAMGTWGNWFTIIITVVIAVIIIGLVLMLARPQQ